MSAVETTDKPFLIDKARVYEAYKAVKSNRGAAGVDGQTIEQFEANLEGNLYRIWNRMRVPSRIVLKFEWRAFGLLDAIRSRGEVNGLMERACGEAFPAIDFSHRDLA